MKKLLPPSLIVLLMACGDPTNVCNNPPQQGPYAIVDPIGDTKSENESAWIAMCESTAGTPTPTHTNGK